MRPENLEQDFSFGTSEEIAGSLDCLKKGYFKENKNGLLTWIRNLEILDEIKKPLDKKYNEHKELILMLKYEIEKLKANLQEANHNLSLKKKQFEQEKEQHRTKSDFGQMKWEL